MTANRWPLTTEQLQRGVPGMRFRRSMHGADGAFPATADYADPIERHDCSRWLDWLWLDVLAAIVLVGTVGAVATGAL